MQRSLPFDYVLKEGCRHAWQTAKNCVKVLLGRKPWDDDRLAFFRQYILHAVGLRPIRAISCAIDNPDEGAGAQALHVMSTIAIARAYALEYLHTPFKAIGHAECPMAEWVAAWEAVFNLGAGEALYDPGRRGVLKAGYKLVYFDVVRAGPEPRKSFQNCFRALIPEFRRKYYLNKAPRVTPDVTVAVHIRRGDVSVSENSHKYTDTGMILRIASAVKSTLVSRGVPFSMHIYGEGSIADFAELSSLDAEFFLDADPIWTMQELVEADILLVARSCFSHYAGLISDGIKIFEESSRRMPPAVLGGRDLEDWLPFQPDGSFDRASFERLLSLLLLAKSKMAAGNAVEAALPSPH